MHALVTGIYGAFYRVQLTDSVDEKTVSKTLLAKMRGKLRIEYARQNQNSTFNRFTRPDNPLAIGDIVELKKLDNEKDEIEAIIVNVIERKNLFCRGSVRRLQLLGANLSGIIIIQSLDFPLFNEGLLNRVLVEAQLSGIEPVIVLNKSDYYKPDSPKKVAYDAIIGKINYLESFGYNVYRETFVNKISKKLIDLCSSGRHIVFGESGVGKSTFVNRLIGEKVQKTREIGASQRGKHTTVNPVLFETLKGGQIIDVPGVREFGLMHHEPASIARGFREFQDLQCKFDNCLHHREPDCGVKEKLQQGEISVSRYDDYIKILSSIHEHHKPRRGDLRQF
ncbi:MAG: ribosome small subunit-dependent GTPase A [Leptospirales bacterium]